MNTTRKLSLTKLKKDYIKKMNQAEKMNDHANAENFSLMIMEIEKLEEAQME